MDVPQRRRNSTSIDEEGNILCQGVKVGECGKTDMQVAIAKSDRGEYAYFTLRVGKAGSTEPYQQTIPIEFARTNRSLFKEGLTLEGPTGQTWTMVCRVYDKVVRFGKGWRKFSVQNRLQDGYQLLFTLVGKFRFLVQFFDRLGKSCTNYPPLPSTQPRSLPLAETQREPGSQSSFQRGFDRGQASHRHGIEGSLMAQTNRSSAVHVNPDQDNAILHQHGPELPPQPSLPYEHMRELKEHTLNAGGGSEDMETEDEGLDEAQSNTPYGNDMDDATTQILKKPERNIHTLNELSRGKQPIFHSPDNRAHSSQIQDYNNSPSSGDELPYQYYSEPLQKEPGRGKRPPPSPVATPVANYHPESGSSSGGSPAMRVLQQQGCMRFSQIVLEWERRDASDQERKVAVDAAKLFVSAMNSDMFSVVMRDEQVYHTFHLAIPEEFLEATGTERNSKVEVCLMDIEQAVYKTHWTKHNFCDTPLLDCDAWAKFAVDHALEEGDVCVFQLLQSRPSVSILALLFCVHIFRVVETPEVGRLDFSDAIDKN